jgi:hypothetical protein
MESLLAAAEAQRLNTAPDLQIGCAHSAAGRTRGPGTFHELDFDMWIRKSEQDIRLTLEARDRRRRNLWRPLAWAAASTVTVGIFYSFGLRAWTQGVIIVSSSRTEFDATTVLIGIVVFAGLFVYLARQQRRGTSLSEDSGLLCGECQQPSHANQ